MDQNLSGRNIVLGYSGGPDATALAIRLISLGAHVLPVYVHYRKTSGGKTAKDLRAAHASLAHLGLDLVANVRAPLGERPKDERNRHLIKVLARVAKQEGAYVVALGTMAEHDDADLEPAMLAQVGQEFGVSVLTWDDFGVTKKSDEFLGLGLHERNALFQTTSCQMWWKIECGNCHSCVARHQAFLAVFGDDPTPYRPHSRVGSNEHR